MNAKWPKIPKTFTKKKYDSEKFQGELFVYFEINIQISKPY